MNKWYAHMVEYCTADYLQPRLSNDMEGSRIPNSMYTLRPTLSKPIHTYLKQEGYQNINGIDIGLAFNFPLLISVPPIVFEMSI